MYFNGVAAMVVHGMNIHALRQQEEVTWMYFNGVAVMVVHGID
jgi:hypothetical protein